MERITEHYLITEYRNARDAWREAREPEGRQAANEEMRYIKHVAEALHGETFAKWLVWNFPQIETAAWRREVKKRNQREAIRNCSNQFRGKMDDRTCMEWLEMSPSTFYKRKKELLSWGIG